MNNTRRDAPVPACKCIRGEGPVRKGRTLHRGRFLLRDRGSPLSTIRCIDTKRTIVGMMSIVAPRLSQIRNNGNSFVEQVRGLEIELVDKFQMDRYSKLKRRLLLHLCKFGETLHPVHRRVK